MKSNILIVALVCGLVTACAPMEQAGLLYTSGYQIGVHVGTGPDKTSPEINVGVLKNDFTYVPVAVAKFCHRRTETTDCQNAIYAMQTIYGKNNITNTVPPPAAPLAAAVGDYVSAYNKWKDADRDYSAKQSKLTADRSADPALTTDQLTSSSTAADTARSTLSDAKDELDKKQKAMNDVVNGGPGKNSGDAKEDALSVYGTFDAKPSGTAGANASAGIELGQVFSAGVASQNLTLGQKNAAEALAMAGCFKSAGDSVLSMTAGSAKDAVLTQALALCGVGSR